VDLTAILYALLALRPGTGHPEVLERATAVRRTVLAG